VPKTLRAVRPDAQAPGDRIVRVTVDQREAGLVMDIVGMQGPVSMTEAPLAA
jgi:hypothetical protein